MSDDMKQVLDDVYQGLGRLQKEFPDKMKPFGEFMKATGGPGKLDVKTKELISVALSVKSQCEYCIAYHVKLALDSGANKDEIMEAAFVAALMGGGPAMMQLPLVQKAIDSNKK
jgi:AhpD family alkylhydroperoxidase